MSNLASRYGELTEDERIFLCDHLNCIRLYHDNPYALPVIEPNSLILVSLAKMETALTHWWWGGEDHYGGKTKQQRHKALLEKWGLHLFSPCPKAKEMYGL